MTSMTVASSSPTLLPLALRDTALTVARLASAAQPDAFGTFAERCDAQIAQLRAELAAAGCAADVIDDAVYAQCALLDESALKYLQGFDRDAWEREPLQVRNFNSHDAGNALIQRIERRLAEPQPVLPLLAIFGAVLGLGFQGKFALHGAEPRAALMRAVNERLGRADHGMTDTVLVRQGTPRRWTGLSPLTWVVLACVVSGLFYLGAQHWLSASIDALPH
ncbi:DotU family type IV/VI secretion system protein [Ralstonia soli]|uniref:DotU family type IV/VI secretion system protein n=1 Tax=Ralstonia soli TaxID=2953896 RepID=A0ABT1AH82_9RALS|nr:DotU/TssL family secretion system protein [Ralstonia soli]MCO5397755.1 DotU family type IV/VI secretion system protein [Ralstonia soli]